MITFAAIALSGDVNVNAIAPGIAAALVATVAGLGVAIPALFAYNAFGRAVRRKETELDWFIARVLDSAIVTQGSRRATNPGGAGSPSRPARTGATY